MERLQRAEPIHILGDSQSLIYDGRLWPRPGAEPYIMRSLYCVLSAERFADEHGALDPEIIARFRDARLLVPVATGGFEAAHCSGDPMTVLRRRVEARPESALPLVLTCGHIDIATIVRMTHHDDFHLPDDIAEWFTVPPIVLTNEPDAAPAFELATMVSCGMMEGLRRGIRSLKAYGFQRLAMLSVNPTGLDDSVFAQVGREINAPIHPARLTLRWRYKLTLLMNWSLRRVCAEEDVTFINRWADQTVNGLAKPGVLADIIHLTSEAADASVAAIAAWADASARPAAMREVTVHAGPAPRAQGITTAATSSGAVG